METTDTVLDAIYDFVDAMITASEISVLDAMCTAWPVDKLDLVLAILTTTLPVKRQLPSRNVLLLRAKVMHGDKDGLFSGL